MSRIKRPLCALFFAVLAALTVFYYLSGTHADPCAHLDRQKKTFTGYVQSKELRNGTDGDAETVLLLRADGMLSGTGKTEDISVCMLVYLTDTEPVPAIGQAVRISGEVHCFADATNPGEFQKRLYYETRGIRFALYHANVEAVGGKGSLLRETLFRLRVFLANALDGCMEETDAGLMKAMLLGWRAQTDASVKDLYRDAGIAHLLAVSGLHFAIAGGCLYRLLRMLRVPQKTGAAICVFVMFVYGILCGMPTSAIRALAMFTLSMIAPVCGRSYDMLSALSFAGILTLAENPRYALDTGFLLSFGSVSSLGLLLPVFRALFPKCFEEQTGYGKRLSIRQTGARVLQKSAQSLFASASVILFTLPVQLCAYGTLSVYSVFINILVVPLMGVLMPLGFLTLFAGTLGVLFAGGVSQTCGALFVGSLLQFVGTLFALPCHLVLSLYTGVCEINRKLPFHTWYAGHPSAWQVCAYYLLLALLVYGVTTGRHARLVRRVNNVVHSHIMRYVNDVWSKRVMHHKNHVGRTCDMNCVNNAPYTQINRDMRLNKKIKRKHKYMYGFSTAMAVSIYLVVAIFMLTIRIAPALQITFLDVGQGDGIVIRQGRHAYLIDGGSTSKTSVGEYQMLPYLKHEGIGVIDAVFISHEDEDHISGILELMDDMANGGIKIRHLFLPDIGRGVEINTMYATLYAIQLPWQNGELTRERYDASRDRYMELAIYAHYLDIPITYLSAGQEVAQDDLIFTCLSPKADGLAASADNANAHSMILYMEYVPSSQSIFFAERKNTVTETSSADADGNMSARFSALFTGDVEEEGLAELNDLLESLPSSMRTPDILKVAHHGSRFTTDERFLSLIDARISVISCGKNNRYGHPHAELLDRLEADGTAILTTAGHGAITIGVREHGNVLYLKPFVPIHQSVN